MIDNPPLKPPVQTRTKAIAYRAQRWMLDEAFPFWADRAPSPEGGFYERLDLAGQGIAGEPSRVRLQARMVFTFSLSANLGWDRARALELTERGLEVLTRDCRRPDGLYGRMVRPGYGLVDDAAETYDTAFALLAFATAYREFGLESARIAGEELNLAIEKLLKRPEEEGGYRERLPAPDIRAQNPHMHLTEASLAWYDATGNKLAIDRARDIIRFVEREFFDPKLGLLLEFSGGAGPDNHVEAGHLFEWVWILGRLKQLSGKCPENFAKALHSGGQRLIAGLDYLPLSQNCDGSVREAKQRTWGPTERLKSHIALWRMEPFGLLAEEIVEAAEQLFADHVDHALPGAWIDIIAPDRTPQIHDITPATGYHIFLAFQELISFADELSG